MSPEEQTDTVTVFEDWNERDGRIYYRWRLEGETEWHEKLTAYKEKPYFEYKVFTEAEWSLKQKKLQANIKPNES